MLIQVNQMKIIFEDKVQALLVFTGFVGDFVTLCISLSNYAPNGVVTIAILTYALLGEDIGRGNNVSSYLKFGAVIDSCIVNIRGRILSLTRGK